MVSNALNWWIAVKTTHVLSAAISISLFFLRGLWMIAESPRLRRLWVRIVPHVNDTILLLSAISLAVMSSQYPGLQGWLTAKVIALFVYVGLGMIALRFGRTKRARIGAWVSGLVVFAYIVSVAVTRSPMSVLH